MAAKEHCVTITTESDLRMRPAIAPDSRPFHVEQHGIDRVSPRDRWATPRDLAGLWAGASINVENFIYGAILMTFGFSLPQALSVIVIGNLSWFLVGLCSLQGPQTGTTVFGVNRASFGPTGSRVPAFFNWLTMLGFETEGLILIVFASLVLLSKAGIHPGTPAKVVLIVGAIAIQTILPFLGHATITKVLKFLVVPFGLVFLGLLVFSSGHAHPGVAAQSWVDWRTWTAGLAFTIALSGLGWAECGNDYSRYLDEDVSKPKTVGWIFLGSAIPEIAMMALGALVFTFLGTAEIWGGANPFHAFDAAHSPIPGWFTVVFLCFTIVQLFGINSLDLYSSGVTLQALGLKLRRHQAVLLDSAICLGITSWAVFSSTFSSFLKEFVTLVIIWIAPWCAIYLVDWAMRRCRFAADELQKTGRTSIYWSTGGFNIAAMVAQLLGMMAALSGVNTGLAFSIPDWMHPITVATEAQVGAASSGADFSIPLGLVVGGVSYFVLASATGVIRRQRLHQDALLSTAALEAEAADGAASLGR